MSEPTGGGYDIGRAFVTLTLSLRGIQKDAAEAGKDAGRVFVASFDEEVGRKSTPLPVPGKPAATKQGAESGGAFADAFTRRVKAALKSLPKAKVGVDATAADAELTRIRERLAALGDVRVGVDLSAAEATAELDRLKARLDELAASSADVQVRADASEAAAQLAAVQAQVDRLDGRTAEVKVDADTAGAEAKVSRLVARSGQQRIRLGFDAPDVSSLLPVRQAVTGLVGVAAAGAPVLFALSSSALQASTSVAALIPAAGGATFAVGTLVAALAGPLGALKAYRAAQKQTADVSASSAATELSNARAVRGAQEALADARRQQSRAAETAAEQIRSAQQRVVAAERDVADAQQDAKRAQQSLNDARRQAIRDLEDLRGRLSSLALDEEGASIGLARAQERLADVNRDSKSSALDRREAAYAVAEAEERLKSVQADRAKTAKDLSAAEKAGVRGNAGVVRAQDALAAAQRRVADAQTGRVEAERDLARAQRTAAQSQDDAARSVARAARAIDDLQAQQAAQAKASGVGSKAAREYADALRELTPQGRTFLKTLIGFGPLLARLKRDGEAATLPGFTRFLLSSRTLFPLVSRGVRLFGRALSDSADDLGRYVGSPLFRRDFASLTDSTARSTRNLGAAVTPLAGAFTSLAVASSPLLERFTGAILRGSRLLDVFLRAKLETGELGGFFTRAGNEMARWGRIVGNFGGGLLGLFRAANPAGKTLAARLESVSARFRGWTASTQGQDKVRSFFQFFADLDYKRLVGIAVTAAKLYGTYSAFKTVGSLARNPFFFLLALAAIRDPEAVSGLVDSVWSAAEPMVTFFASHPNVFTGAIAFLAALRLTAAAKGVPGLLKGIPGLSGKLGIGGGPVAGARDVKSRAPGSPNNPIVTAGGAGGGGSGGKSGGGGLLASASIAATAIAILAPFVKGALDRTKAGQGGVKDLGILTGLGQSSQGLRGLSPETYRRFAASFEPVRRFYQTTIPGWAQSGVSAVGRLFTRPAPVAATGLATAYTPVRTWFQTTVPSWARTGLGTVTGLFTRPAPVAATGFAGAYTSVRGFFTATTPSWARTGLGLITGAFSRPPTISPAGFSVAYAGVRAFFLTAAPGWARSGVTLIGRAFDGLKSLLAAPVNWVITNVLNRLISAANYVITKFGGTALAPFPLIGQDGARQTSAPAPSRGRAFAEGGYFSGRLPGAPSATDNLLASSPTGPVALATGEYVVNAESTSAWLPVLDWINRQRRGAAGRPTPGMPGYAIGGLIGKVKTVADWGKAGIRSLQSAAAGGLRAAVEYLLAPIRSALESPQAGPLLAQMSAGAINAMVRQVFGYADSQRQVGDPSSGGVSIPANVTGRIAAILGRIRGWDPLPYIWGATGPGAFDCSGITGAVYGLLTGRGGGSGQRYFTTSSNFESLGFRRGTGSDYVIGVNPGTHMAGRLAGLPFEAQSTATGILVGNGATPTSRFAVQYYLPGVSATAGTKTAPVAKYDSGGYLPPGLSLALNATRKPEPVFTAAQYDALMSGRSGGGGNTYSPTVNNYGREVTARDIVTLQRQLEALS